MTLNVKRRGGHLDLIAGDWGEPGSWLAFEDPWGNTYPVVSGDKPERGAGGFEFQAAPGEPWTVKHAASGRSWTFEHRPGETFLTWSGGEPEPEPPKPEPGPEPQPGKILVKPGRVYSGVLEDGWISWHEGEREGAAWTYVGHYLPGADLWLDKREPALPLLAAWCTELRLKAERLERALLRRI